MSAQFQHEFAINYDPNYNYAELKAKINKVKVSIFHQQMYKTLAAPLSPKHVASLL